jgi:hypothetical protein
MGLKGVRRDYAKANPGSPLCLRRPDRYRASASTPLPCRDGFAMISITQLPNWRYILLVVRKRPAHWTEEMSMTEGLKRKTSAASACLRGFI